MDHKTISDSGILIVDGTVQAYIDNVMQWHWPEWQTPATPSKPRFGLQFKAGESRAMVQGRFDNVDAADQALRDEALGLAQKLEAWAKRPYLDPNPPLMTPEGEEPAFCLE